ncbi:MAG: hypothetical protein Kow00108_10890 [Calditrichia bacterium]
MADEPLENDELDLENEFDEEESGSEQKSSFLKKGLPIIAVQAIIAYFLATYVLVPMFVDPVDANPNANPTSVTDSAGNSLDTNFMDIGPIYKIEDIIVNPAGSNGERYVVMNLALELQNEDVQPEIEKREPIVRDVAIQLLSSVPVDSLDGAMQKQKLKEVFLAEIKKVLPPKTLKRVFFTNFIIQ